MEQNCRHVLGMIFMVTVYLFTAAAIETEKLLGLPITQNMDLQTRLWSVFRNKEKGESKPLTIGVEDRSLEAIKCRNCLINCR